MLGHVGSKFTSQLALLLQGLAVAKPLWLLLWASEDPWLIKDWGAFCKGCTKPSF